ncbi:MAG: hypothetical protein AAFW87_01910 [Pseudomonadota bacterium]
MTFRKIAFATALTSAGALSAYADTVGDDVSTNGKTLENAAEVGTEGTYTVDKDTYSTNGKEIVTISGEIKGSNDEGVVDNGASVKKTEIGATTEPENILAVAEKGTIVRTVTGETIGTVAYKQDQGDAGHLVFVDIDPSAGLQVPTVGIQVKSLQTVPEGSVLEYAFSMEYLYERIQEQLDS